MAEQLNIVKEISKCILNLNNPNPFDQYLACVLVGKNILNLDMDATYLSRHVIKVQEETKNRGRKTNNPKRLVTVEEINNQIYPIFKRTVSETLKLDKPNEPIIFEPRPFTGARKSAPVTHVLQSSQIGNSENNRYALNMLNKKRNRTVDD